MAAIVWFRNDLRLHDHTALYQASELGEPILPVVFLDQALLTNPAVCNKRVHAYLSAVRSLQADLQSRGIKLVVRKGNPVEELPKLVEISQADKLFFNRAYTPQAIARDEEVASVLLQRGVHVQVFKDDVLHEIDEIRNKQGKPYVVFTPYKRTWLQLPKQKPYPAPSCLNSIKAYEQIDSDPIPTIEQLGLLALHGEEWDWQHFGEEAARRKLEAFVEQRIFRYKYTRDIPAVEGTSRLSFALQAGTLSVRTIYHQVMECLHLARGEETESVEAFLSELIWREFYRQILFHFPFTATQAFLPEYEEVAWQNDQHLFQLWCNGETGYPIVDAAMRQLKESGWMHNRLRMITASFLTKDLLIDWRWGADYFAEQLIDYDEASNTGGWQWCASTGTDAQPYFRIFNPVAQGEKFDSQGEFVRRYLPALRNVPDRFVHQPWKLSESQQEAYGCRIGLDYPAPCVDHAIQRQLALSLFQQAKEQWTVQKK